MDFDLFRVRRYRASCTLRFLWDGVVHWRSPCPIVLWHHLASKYRIFAIWNETSLVAVQIFCTAREQFQTLKPHEPHQYVTLFPGAAWCRNVEPDFLKVGEKIWWMVIIGARSRLRLSLVTTQGRTDQNRMAFTEQTTALGCPQPDLKTGTPFRNKTWQPWSTSATMLQYATIAFLCFLYCSIVFCILVPNQDLQQRFRRCVQRQIEECVQHFAALSCGCRIAVIAGKT